MESDPSTVTLVALGTERECYGCKCIGKLWGCEGTIRYLVLLYTVGWSEGRKCRRTILCDYRAAFGKQFHLGFYLETTGKRNVTCVVKQYHLSRFVINGDSFYYGNFL